MSNLAEQKDTGVSGEAFAFWVGEREILNSSWLYLEASCCSVGWHYLPLFIVIIIIIIIKICFETFWDQILRIDFELQKLFENMQTLFNSYLIQCVLVRKYDGPGPGPGALDSICHSHWPLVTTSHSPWTLCRLLILLCLWPILVFDEARAREDGKGRLLLYRSRIWI